MNQSSIQHVEMRSITKRFPGVLANDGVDFEVRAGEIHALLGENGAGKSTLMRQLYGLYQPDAGAILIDGRPVTFTSPSDAIAARIGMVHQHFMLVPTLTVAENVALGLPSSRGLRLDLDVVSARIRELSATYGLDVKPDAEVWTLSVGQQQRVEIIKALYRGASLLIMDEPTAVLTPQEVNELFVTLRQMVADGRLIIFISHKLHEVTAISSRVTVLRDGRVVGTVNTADTNRNKLAYMMVGREIAAQPERPPVIKGEARLRLRGVCADGDAGLQVVCGIDLDVHAGEIVGVAGVSGNGQRELAEVIAGLRSCTAGAIEMDGQDITHAPTGARIKAGLAYIPEERMRDGTIKDFTVEENAILLDHGCPPFSQGVFLNFGTIADYAEHLIEAFDVKTPSRNTLLKSLSGGNIQKLILARELTRDPKVLIAAQPTRGVDIGATEYIHKRLVEQRAKGTATLLISEDLDEIRALSDRIAVMYEGMLMGVVDRDAATVEQLGLMMAGVREEEALAESAVPARPDPTHP
ncbi:MAG: ABC transporter ATP-binding protein [Anaerolineae bacterium]|nr:ABC transporter ATP-binding protein [Anaerolineae bacterium]